MGIFGLGRQSIPQPVVPEMSLHFDHNDPNKIFRPNDLITGKIAFIPREPITPQAIVVGLFGNSMVWHRTSTNHNNNRTYYHWRDHAPLFEVTQNVLPDQQKPGQQPVTYQPNQTYFFPFSFRFPMGTANNRMGQYENDMDDRWISTPHPLPPTFLRATKSDDSDADYARIDYGVSAELVCPGIGIVQDKTNLVNLRTVGPILFQPLNTAQMGQNMQPPGVNILRKKLHYQSSVLTGQASSQIGFRQSMRDRFSSSTPSIDFELGLELPQVLNSGSEFNIRASLNVLSRSDAATDIPAIRFRITKLQLQDFIFIRAPYDDDAYHTYSGQHRSDYDFMPRPDAMFHERGRQREFFHEDKTVMNSAPEFKTVELDVAPAYEEKKEKAMQQANKCEAWFSARIPGYTVPSFRSFAITRAYRIRVKLEVIINEKEFELDQESQVHSLESALQ